MSSNTSSICEVSASSYEDGHEPYKAFDKDKSTTSYWASNVKNTGYLQIEFYRPVRVLKFNFYIRNSGSYNVLYSSDGITWNNIDTVTTYSDDQESSLMTDVTGKYFKTEYVPGGRVPCIFEWGITGYSK